MQPAHYLHIFPGRNSNELLLYALPKASSILVSAEMLSAFNEVKLPGEAARALSKMGFLVNDRNEEKENVLTYIDRLNRINQVIRVSVILSLACNFACKYCYEGNLKGDHFMDLDTANMLVRYLKNRFGPDKKKMVLDFYGGEPLLSLAMIRHIAGKLQPWVEKKGGRFEFTLVTNGSLLTRDIVADLIRHGLTQCRVTIDGPAESHNISRPFKNGRASYDVILNNLLGVCELVKIVIGGNFTRKNFRQFPKLLDDLLAHGLTPDRLLRIKFTQAMNTSGKHAPKYSEGCGSVDEPWLADAAMFLREEILKRGFKTSKPVPSPCMVDLNDSFAIHYDGAIYKCTAMIGLQNFSVGDLKNGIRDHSKAYAKNNWRNERRCMDCKYLPLCFGGCRYARYQRTGSINGVDCMESYLDQSLETMLLQDLRYTAPPTVNQTSEL